MALLVDEPDILLDAVPRFLKTQGVDPVTTQLIVPGLEYQIQIDGRPKRIPIGRNTDHPAFVGELITQTEIASRIDLIGVTGWNWQSQETQFIILDFDADDHDAGYARDVLDLVIEAARQLGWVWVRHSKGGRGIHLVVALSQPMPAKTGKEHQRNARSIVAQMTRDSGFDFRKYLDCGGVVGYVWARSVAPNGFAVLVAPTCATPLIELTKAAEEFAPVCNNEPPLELSQQHRDDIKEMQAAGFIADYSDGRLRCHSKGFEVLYRDRGRPGNYRSRSAGRNPGKANAFAFPLDDGGWIVSRFSTTPAGECSCWYANAQGFATARVRPPIDWLVSRFNSQTYGSGAEQSGRN